MLTVPAPPASHHDLLLGGAESGQNGTEVPAGTLLARARAGAVQRRSNCRFKNHTGKGAEQHAIRKFDWRERKPETFQIT